MQPTILLQELIEALSLGSLYALATLGIALLFGVLGLVNFAYSELITIGAYALTWSLVLELPWYVAVVVVIAIVVVAAVLQDRVAFRPFRSASGTTLMVTSFALSNVLQAVAGMAAGARPVGVQSPIGGGEQVSLLGLYISRADALTIGATFALLIGLTVFMRRTDVGIQMRAAAEDFRMARLSGVRADVVIGVAFAIAGASAGILAILLVARSGAVTPTLGVPYVLIAFVATVIGGMGRLDGAVLGAYILGVLNIGLATVLPVGLESFRDAFAYSIVILVLLVRPQGLLGSATAPR